MIAADLEGVVVVVAEVEVEDAGAVVIAENGIERGCSFCAGRAIFGGGWLGRAILGGGGAFGSGGFLGRAIFGGGCRGGNSGGFDEGGHGAEALLPVGGNGLTGVAQFVYCQ